MIEDEEERLSSVGTLLASCLFCLAWNFLSKRSEAAPGVHVDVEGEREEEEKGEGEGEGDSLESCRMILIRPVPEYSLDWMMLAGEPLFPFALEFADALL